MKKFLQILYPLSIFLLVQLSNFVTKLNEQSGDINFSVFFGLCLAVFLIGYLYSQQNKWESNFKILSWLLVLSILFTVPVGYNFIVFDPKREVKIYLTINMVFKNIILFGISLLGISLSEVWKLKKENYELSNELDKFQSEKMQKLKLAELELYEAKLKANEMIEQAKLELQNLKQERKRIENEIKEFISTEWKFIKNFEKGL